MINKVGSVFYGPILGAFILAMLTRKTHALGANIGIISGVLFNIYLWLSVPQIFWFWWNAIGCIITIAIGMGISYSLPKPQEKSLEVANPSGLREIGVLLGYFVFILGISYILPKLF